MPNVGGLEAAPLPIATDLGFSCFVLPSLGLRTADRGRSVGRLGEITSSYTEAGLSRKWKNQIHDYSDMISSVLKSWLCCLVSNSFQCRRTKVRFSCHLPLSLELFQFLQIDFT